MPVLSRCPLCRGVMPDSQGGEARCRRCGELVLPAVRKLCAGCGTDVTRGKRVRDEGNGEYYCHDCWDAKVAHRGEAARAAVIDQLCNTCGLAFTAGQVYQDGDTVVCKDCYAQRARESEVLAGLAEAAAAADAVGSAGDAVDPAFAPTASGPGIASRSRGSSDPTARYPRTAGTPWELVSFCIAAVLAIVAVLLVVLLGK